MKLVPPAPPARPPTPKEWEWILAARPAAARAALRLGAGNSLGFTPSDLRALAEDGLMSALRTFDPAVSDFETFSWLFVRGSVLHAFRARRRVLRHEVPEGAAREQERARDRAGLDGLSAGIDAGDDRLFEDTEDDFMRDARELVDDGLLVLVLGRAARGAGAAEARLIKRELLEKLDSTVEGLPPVLARLVRLRFYEERTGDEIAAITGMPRSTVYQQLGLAVGVLRGRMS